MRKWFDRYGFWIAIIIACIAYYRRFISSSDVGMTLYPQAAQCLLDNQILQKCDLPFTYPPAFAFVMIPLVPAPLWLRELIWYAITIAASLAVYALSERLASRMIDPPPTGKEQMWGRVIAVVLSLKFVLAVFENQAYDAFALLFIMLGLCALADGRKVGAGACLGVAAAIKATPLIFLPYLLFKRQYAAAAAFVAAMLALSFAPDLFFTPAGATHGYFTTWLLQVAGPAFGADSAAAKLHFWAGANALNHSLRGAVSLQIDEVAHPLLHKTAVDLADAAFVILAVALIGLRRAKTELIAIDGAVLLIGMLLLSPMTSRSHYVVLVLPYTVLTMTMLRDRVHGRIGAALLGASFFFLTLTSNDVVGKAMSDFAYFHSFLVIGVLLLLVYIAIVVRDAAPRPMKALAVDAALPPSEFGAATGR
jgi:hypothetical protein